MIIATFILMFAIPVSAETFSDVNESDWFYDEVLAGVEHGYINGYEDGSFKPNNLVSKGEFYKMIAIAFNLEIPDPEEVNSTHWAVPYSKALFRDGNKHIDTYPGKLGYEIKRKEAIRDLVFVAGDVRSAINDDYFEIETFVDMPNPTIWSYDGYILVAKVNGVVNGDGNGFVHPEETITRAEAVALIERALTVNEWIVPESDTLKGLNIEYVGEYAETFKEDLCHAIEKYPRELIDAFINNNGKILVTDEDSSKYYTNSTSEVSGIYLPSENKIVLFTNGQSSSLFFGLTGTLVHEFAHYIYDEVVTNSDKQALTKIFNEGIEPETLTKITYDSYGETNIQEYWAELVCYQLSSRLGYADGEIPQSIAIVEKYVPQYIYTK